MRRTALLLVPILVLTSLAYFRVLDGPPIFDDGYVFDDGVRDPASREWGGLVAAVTETEAEPNRWLTSLTFTANFALFGAATTSFHVVNLVLHLLAVLACFGFLRSLLLLAGREREEAARVALIAAALFAVHPIQTQAVSYVWQRATVLAGGLSLASLWFFVSGLRRGRWKIAVAVLLVPPAVLAKQNAIMLPFAMLGTWLLFAPPTTPSGITRLLLGIGGAIVVVFAAAAFWFGGTSVLDVIADGYDGRDFTMGERLLTQPRVVVFLLSLILLPLPSRLNLDHDLAASTGLLSPWTTAASLALIAVAVGYAIVVARRRPLVAFGILWFFVMLVPESTVYALELMFEHRAFLPSVGVFLLAALGLDLALRNQRVVGTAATVAILLLLAAMTWLRNEVWTSRVRMWEDVTAKSPEKARGFYNLGLACGDRSPPAMRAFREAVKLGHGSLSVQCLMEHRVARWGSFDDVRGDIRLLLDAGENQWAEIYLQDIRHDLGDDPRIVFEEARNYALWGAFSEAEECLGWAIELGFDDRTALLAEPAFRKLRHRPRFRQLVSKLE